MVVKSMPPLSSAHYPVQQRVRGALSMFRIAVQMHPTRASVVLCVARTVNCSVHAFVIGSRHSFFSLCIRLV